MHHINIPGSRKLNTNWSSDFKKCKAKNKSRTGLTSSVVFTTVILSIQYIHLILSGFLGPLSSWTTSAVAEMTGKLPVSVLSPRAMSTTLSDIKKYPYFLRTSPSSRAQAQVREKSKNIPRDIYTVLQNYITPHI